MMFDEIVRHAGCPNQLLTKYRGESFFKSSSSASISPGEVRGEKMVRCQPLLGTLFESVTEMVLSGRDVTDRLNNIASSCPSPRVVLVHEIPCATPDHSPKIRVRLFPVFNGL
jgi:hypothetical protein